MDLKHRKVLEMYQKMVLLRLFEQKAMELYWEGINRGALHPYVGEEAVAVGVCSALVSGDFITSTHRGHGHCLAMGGDPALMLAELLGKKNGYCRGKGGSMHIADPALGILGANGIVGAGIPIATGAALALDYRETNNLVVCFFGDGATSTGAFHEGLNMASVWKLPVVFVCENNLYAISSCAQDCIPVHDLSDRAKGYDMTNTFVDGNDVMAVYETMVEARRKVVEEHGPVFIECKTYRTEGHWIADPQIYRDKQEVEAWRERCPIKTLRSKMLEYHPDLAPALDEIEQAVTTVVNQAAQFARESPEPDINELLEDVLA